MHSTEDLNCTASLDDLYYLQFHSFQRACAESCRRKFPNIPPGSHKHDNCLLKVDLNRFTLYTVHGVFRNHSVHRTRLPTWNGGENTPIGIPIFANCKGRHSSRRCSKQWCWKKPILGSWWQVFLQDPCACWVVAIDAPCSFEKH